MGGWQGRLISPRDTQVYIHTWVDSECRPVWVLNRCLYWQVVVYMELMFILKLLTAHWLSLGLHSCETSSESLSVFMLPFLRWHFTLFLILRLSYCFSSPPLIAVCHWDVPQCVFSLTSSIAWGLKMSLWWAIFPCSINNSLINWQNIFVWTFSIIKGWMMVWWWMFDLKSILKKRNIQIQYKIIPLTLPLRSLWSWC